MELQKLSWGNSHSTKREGLHVGGSGSCLKNEECGYRQHHLTSSCLTGVTTIALTLPGAMREDEALSSGNPKRQQILAAALRLTFQDSQIQITNQPPGDLASP